MRCSLGQQKQFHGGFFDVHAVGDQFRIDLRRSKYGAYNARVAVGKRTHRVVEVSSAARASGHGRPSLLVSCVGMPHRDDQAGFSRGINARSGPEHFRRNRQNSGISRGGLEEAAERLRRRQLNPFGWMNSAALFADERPLEMDSQDFRAGFIRFVLMGDVPGDSLSGTQSFVRTRRYRGGDKGRRAIF